MARVSKNTFTKGLSGMVGKDMVFRQVGGRTIVSTRPEPQSEDSLTERQLAQRRDFKRAVAYARAKLLIPEEKQAYKEIAAKHALVSAFAAAVGDYLKAPEIMDIDTTAYAGNVGDFILIEAQDNFKVNLLTVTITLPDGTVLESGQATLPDGEVDFQYVATLENEFLEGSTITAEAKDKPGNVVTFIKEIA